MIHCGKHMTRVETCAQHFSKCLQERGRTEVSGSEAGKKNQLKLSFAVNLRTSDQTSHSTLMNY